MNDLLHKLVSAVITGALIALVGYLSVTVLRRRVAREEAAAPAPVEDPTQTLLRQAQQLDLSRDELAAQSREPEALARAREAAAAWRALTGARPGRFQAERRAALGRLGELLDAGGQEQQAAQVRQEAAGLS
uniref:Secreted protein n=1 Tax=Streptomyces sp. NBC_00003 TaxID=2903608 RepID=A0AAU2UX08_9ACTN